MSRVIEFGRWNHREKQVDEGESSSSIMDRVRRYDATRGGGSKVEKIEEENLKAFSPDMESTDIWNLSV
jgi:hypothetical protein